MGSTFAFETLDDIHCRALQLLENNAEQRSQPLTQVQPAVSRKKSLVPRGYPLEKLNVQQPAQKLTEPKAALLEMQVQLDETEDSELTPAAPSE